LVGRHVRRRARVHRPCDRSAATTAVHRCPRIPFAARVVNLCRRASARARAARVHGGTQSHGGLASTRPCRHLRHSRRRLPRRDLIGGTRPLQGPSRVTAAGR